jgi:hypothetical protein
VNRDTGTVAAKFSVVLTSRPPRTGIGPLDGVLGPWPRPLGLITGPRGVGRSALAAQIALTAAVVDGRATRLVSLCEDDAEVLARLICAQAGVPLHHFRTGQLREANLPLIEAAVRTLEAAPLSLEASTSSGVPGSVERVLNGSSGVEMLIVDDADLWAKQPPAFLPHLRAWARRTNTVVVVTAADDSVQDQDGGVSRYWGRHCDVVMALRPLSGVGVAKLDGVEVKVFGPAGRVLGRVNVELESHCGRMVAIEASMLTEREPAR